MRRIRSAFALAALALAPRPALADDTPPYDRLVECAAYHYFTAEAIGSGPRAKEFAGEIKYHREMVKRSIKQANKLEVPDHPAIDQINADVKTYYEAMVRRAMRGENPGAIVAEGQRKCPQFDPA